MTARRKISVFLLILTTAISSIETAVAKHADARIMTVYKKKTWVRYQRQKLLAANSSSNDVPGVPDTDCPPLPSEECLKTWKIKTINPFE